MIKQTWIVNTEPKRKFFFLYSSASFRRPTGEDPGQVMKLGKCHVPTSWPCRVLSRPRSPGLKPELKRMADRWWAFRQGWRVSSSMMLCEGAGMEEEVGRGGVRGTGKAELPVKARSVLVSPPTTCVWESGWHDGETQKSSTETCTWGNYCSQSFVSP